MKKIALLVWGVFCILFINLNQFALANNDPESNEEANIPAEEEKGVFSVDAYVDVLSRDVDKYTGEVSKRVISHPSVTVTHNESQIYIGALTYVTEKFEETDFYIGKSFEAAGISFDAGAGYYAVADDEDFAALYLQARFPEIFNLTPIVYVESNYGLDGGRGGVFWKFGVEKSFKVFGREFLSEIEVGGNDGLYGYDPEFIAFGRLTLSTEAEWSEFTFTPFVSLQRGNDEEGIAGDDTQMYAGMSVAVSLF